jgi:hypothetical protein
VLKFGRRYLSGPLDTRQLEGNRTSKRKFYNPSITAVYFPVREIGLLYFKWRK